MDQENKPLLEGDWESFKRTLLWILIFLLLAFILRACHAETKLAETNSLYEKLEDSLTTWKDKEGNFKAKISVLESEKTEAFLKLHTSDSTVLRLQDLVSKYKKQLDRKGSATIINTDADIDLTEPTIVYIDSTKPCEPIYESKFEIMGTGKYKDTKWVWGIINASKDSTTIGMRFHEEIDVVIGEEKTGFLGLGKPKPFAEVTLHNPFNKVTTLKTYSKSTITPKRFGVGPTLAYGIGSGFTPQVFIGVGVNWNLIKF